MKKFEINRKEKKKEFISGTAAGKYDDGLNKLSDPTDGDEYENGKVGGELYF